MASDESDIELPSALPKKPPKKILKSPSEELLKENEEKKKPVKVNQEPTVQDPKKLTTKIMVQQALIDLKSRKGVSFYAIKKYLAEKYNVDTDKLNYVIKKYIKSAVEEGTIVQTKGIGVSGSFKLVPIKEKKKSKPKKVKLDKDGKEKKKNSDKPKKKKESSKKAAEKVIESKTKPKESKSKKEKGTPKKKMGKEKVSKDKTKGDVKTKKVKIVKGMQTPAKKKAAMMKRKSIGSIIKPPKMKPKAKA